MNDNCVIFKGKKDGLVVLLDERTGYDEIKVALRQKVREGRKFFGDARAAVEFTGRGLSKEEKMELLSIMSDETNLNISYNERKQKQEPVAPSAVSASNNLTIFHKGSVRSGQVITYPGSIVIIGDVNPGGEIIAEGNIVVLGSLKGIVHAGCGGNSECFVSAINLKPMQIRIADVLTYIPNEMNQRNKEKGREKEKNAPSYAYIKEGQIYIAPLS